MTILENNCVQSIATAAGYMTMPLTSGLAAYMWATNSVLPAWQIICFTIVLSVLGVLVAFPMKRRFINDEQHPFPEGRAGGVSFLSGENCMRLVQQKWLGLPTSRHLPLSLDGRYYALAATDLFFLLFGSRGFDHAAGASVMDTMVTNRFSFPGALQWKGVSDLVSAVFGGGSGARRDRRHPPQGVCVLLSASTRSRKVSYSSTTRSCASSCG